ncbi:hypothetical protein BGZ75_001595 [Mortierella antarctica]|nr:hypothetical protein BGZ75_001595 [Mortierella antarctica]
MSAIERPLETIQDLFNKNWKLAQPSEKNEFGVPEHFQNLFDTREKLQEIPVLDANSIRTLPKNALVRFRCMVQDTELSQEVALLASTTISQPNGEEEFGSDRSQDIMDLRSSYYCISVPGETQWVKEYEQPASNSLASALQGLTVDDVKAPQIIPERYPFPGDAHFAAVVKTHSSDISIGVTDTVDVIGVLGANDRVLLSGDSFEFHEESANTPHIPTVHAILMRKVEDHGHPELKLDGRPGASDLELHAKDAEAIRKELIQYIAPAVHGDLLAAELVLLQFMSRVYSRPSGAVLGKLSLNLRDTSANSVVPQNLTRVLQSVLPKFHVIPMTLNTLNNNFFFPRGEEQLSSGILQVTRGTTLLLDETVMEEGTLVDKGIKNLKAVSDISLYQTLSYVFPFNSLDFQTDISLLIVSLGNSLVPVDCAITLRPEPSGTVQPSQPTETQLKSFRKYVSVSRLADYTLSEEMAKEIETEFMEQRRAATAAGTALTTPNELAFKISLARLVALSRGERVLSKQSWEHAVSLSALIKSREKQ